MPQILRKITQETLRMTGILYASIIMIPATIFQGLFSTPYLIYKSNNALIRIQFFTTLVAFFVFLTPLLIIAPMLPAQIFLSIGAMIFINTLMALLILTPALALTPSIKQCGEQFAHFSFLEGLKLPFNSLLKQLKTIFAYIPELNKAQEGEYLAALYHRDEEEKPPSKLIACRQAQMAAIKMSSTAEIIKAHIDGPSSWYSGISSCVFAAITHKDLVPTIVNYLIDTTFIIASVKRALIEEKSGQPYKQFQQAAAFEYLHVTNRKILTKAEQQQKLESKIESKVEETFVNISHVRS